MRVVESWLSWEFSAIIIDYHQVWAKREKTFDDSQEKKFEQVHIRRDRTRVDESAWEFQAKLTRARVWTLSNSVSSSFGAGLRSVYLLQIANSRQLFSSSPLEQSFVPSHTAVARRHPPPWQVNLLVGHAQFSSSEPSLHAKSPSHTRFFLMHSPFLHVNWLSLHLKPDHEHLCELIRDPQDLAKLGWRVMIAFVSVWSRELNGMKSKLNKEATHLV